MEKVHTFVLGFFNEVGMDIENYRRQSYFNASNMSGMYAGLQALIREKNNTQIRFHASHIHSTWLDIGRLTMFQVLRRLSVSYRTCTLSLVACLIAGISF